MGEVGADWMPWFDVLFRSFGKTFGGTFTFLPIAARFHTSFYPSYLREYCAIPFVSLLRLARKYAIIHLSF